MYLAHLPPDPVVVKVHEASGVRFHLPRVEEPPSEPCPIRRLPTSAPLELFWWAWGPAPVENHIHFYWYMTCCQSGDSNWFVRRKICLYKNTDVLGVFIYVLSVFSGPRKIIHNLLENWLKIFQDFYFETVKVKIFMFSLLLDSSGFQYSLVIVSQFLFYFFFNLYFL